VEFASDVEKLRTLFDQFCGWKGEFLPHAMFGQLSTPERMRHAYLHMDHHLRQFGHKAGHKGRVECLDRDPLSVGTAKHFHPAAQKGFSASAAVSESNA
jgi:Protein of unknown function (DUF1569)